LIFRCGTAARLLVLLVLLPATGVQAQTLHIAHCLAGCPRGTEADNELVVRHLYAVSINARTHLADWVAYRVLKDTIGVASLLPREWRADDLSANSLQPDTLAGADTGIRQPNLENQQDQAYRLTEILISPGDRGRLVPMSSFAATAYWSDLNLLSVMSLQKSDMRQGPWARLDQAINALARSEGEVAVVSGPVYDALDYEAGRGEDGVMPRAFYKVVALADGRLSAFVFLQDLPQHASYCRQLTSVEEVERSTGLELFPLQPDWPRGDLNLALGCP
jgi:endonuclease G